MSQQIERPLSHEEQNKLVLDLMDDARKAGYADILISWHRGQMDKVDLTIKRRGETLRNMRHFQEGVNAE